MFKKQQVIEIKPTTAIYAVYISTFLLTIYLYFNNILAYLDMLIWPYNYMILGSISIAGYGLCYEIVQNWFEGWKTSDRKARAIQFTQCGLVSMVTFLLAGAFVLSVIFYGGDLDWVFYAQIAMAIVTMIFGIGIGQAMKQSLRPAGLKKRKRA